MTALASAPRADGVAVTTSLVADARTNSVLIGGDKNERLRLRALIAHLDTPLEDGGDTQVRYLRYADAEELATKLQQHFTQQAQAAAGQAAAGGAGVQMNEVSVWADTQTNALVVNAPPKMMRSLMLIVDKLDIRRRRVFPAAAPDHPFFNVDVTAVLRSGLHVGTGQSRTVMGESRRDRGLQR